MSASILAWVDMRPHFAAAMVILIVGAWVVVLLSRRGDGSDKLPRRWIPLTSLVAGPLLAFGFWAIEVLMLHPDFYRGPFQGDAVATLSGVLMLGSIVGVVVSVVLAIVLSPGRTSRTVRNENNV